MPGPVVDDRKPPRSHSGELETLLLLLQYHRDSLLRKVADLDEESARRELVPTGTTLLWLSRHMARAESLWMEQRFAGLDATVEDDTVTDDDTVAGAVAAYRAAMRRTDTIVNGASSLDVLCRGLPPDDRVNLRWVIMHLLEETARHAGHADILRELIDGRTGR